MLSLSVWLVSEDFLAGRYSLHVTGDACLTKNKSLKLLKLPLMSAFCRYAFPDLTNEQGYWAKAVPEAIVQRGIVLFFFINVGSTEVRYGVNDVEVGVFFNGVQTSSPLWALLDLYGSTVAVEFMGAYTCCSLLIFRFICRLFIIGGQITNQMKS